MVKTHPSTEEIKAYSVSQMQDSTDEVSYYMYQDTFSYSFCVLFAITERDTMMQQACLAMSRSQVIHRDMGTVPRLALLLRLSHMKSTFYPIPRRGDEWKSLVGSEVTGEDGEQERSHIQLLFRNYGG
ncbi:hypothetical protein E2C01_013615 [Portunus trituberculatus]|uniref:Uncharacterized protein n=1 Tax=Portunus trituberculatus TaxID=210409 RepID=A0A5B7DH36_PORTR|nr:hypothetical protein [Portunus trituberculatus]